MADSDELIVKAPNLWNRKQEKHWLDSRESCLWASTELPSTSAPPFQSKERKLICDALVMDEKALESLETQLQELRKDVIKKRAQISPSRLIPPEILTRIFHFVASGIMVMAFAYGSPMPSVFAVCKQWYTVGLATASLWDTVAISPKPRGKLHGNNRRLKTWLARSRAPLCIQYRKEYQGEARISDWAALYYTDRPWKSFECSSAPELITHLFSASPNIALLETLSLSNRDVSLYLEKTLVFPKLEEIKLAGLWIPSALGRIRAPNIRSMTLCHCNIETSDMVAFAQTFQTLVTLRLYNVELHTYSNEIEASPHFPCLENLHYESSPRHNYELDLLVFQSNPRLHNLSIISDDFCNTMHAASLRFVTKLTVMWSYAGYYYQTIPNLYVSVPHLLNLHFYNSKNRHPNATNVLRPLRAKTPLVCTQLTLLSLERVHVPDREILKAVSRFRSGAASGREPSLPQATLLITINACRHLPNVSEASYKTLCMELDNCPE